MFLSFLVNFFVLVSGNEILNLSNLIIEDVREKFGVHLEREVNIL